MVLSVLISCLGWTCTFLRQLISIVFFALHIFLFTQALFETRSLIWGEWYTFTCRRGKGEGWWNRMGYTWVGITWFSIIFYIWFLYMYEVSNHSCIAIVFEYLTTTPSNT